MATPEILPIYAPPSNIPPPNLNGTVGAILVGGLVTAVYVLVQHRPSSRLNECQTIRYHLPSDSRLLSAQSQRQLVSEVRRMCRLLPRYRAPVDIAHAGRGDMGT